ncbi:MAG: ClbS/DfsB family four-helix bundle protein [Anaerolineae bacterium]|nr:ClbS/DfsB family four-helix bundle protein [Anaerolineae bacterium]
MTDIRSQLIAELQQARSEMIAQLDEIDKNRKIYPLWTIREILAHITGWDDAIIASLSAHIAGREPGTPAMRGLDVYNAETVATREGLDYDHIYREYIRTRDILIDLIGGMPLEKAAQPFTMLWGDQGDLKILLTVFIEHEIEHAGDVRKIISDSVAA